MKKNWLITNSLLMFIIVISAVSILPNFHVFATSCGSNPFIVQCTAANTAGTIASSGTTSTITVTAGNGLIIVGGFASGNTANSALSCSDNLAQSWTQIVQQNQNPNSGLALNSIICYKANTVGGADAGTITINTAAQGYIVIALYEVTPALSFSGILSESCKQFPQTAADCITNTLHGNFGAPLNNAGGWNIAFSNASLVLSVVGGTPVGTGVNITTPNSFDAIVQRNIVAGTNSSQMIAEGSGTYACSCLTGRWLSGVAAAFGPFIVSTTVTSTITGFLVPNFVNGVNSFSWLYFLIVVLVPMGEIIGVITMERQALLDRHAIIFIFLSLLLLDSIFGVMLNVVTVAMPFIFGILFGVYLWRGRG